MPISFDLLRSQVVVFDVLQKYAGASIAGAVKLNQCANDVVINWSGGLHHAKKSEVGLMLSEHHDAKLA